MSGQGAGLCRTLCYSNIEQIKEGKKFTQKSKALEYLQQISWLSHVEQEERTLRKGEIIGGKHYFKI
jgi:hypothetical protein